VAKDEIRPERKRYEVPGEPGKYDAVAKSWARDYTTHLRMLQGMSWRAASVSPVRTVNGLGVKREVEQEAWERSLSNSGSGAGNLCTAFFEGELCRGGCGREVVRFNSDRVGRDSVPGSGWGTGAAVVQNDSGAWRGTVRGMCATCNAREVRAGRVG
jgi:hypothetical protein